MSDDERLVDRLYRDWEKGRGSVEAFARLLDKMERAGYDLYAPLCCQSVPEERRGLSR